MKIKKICIIFILAIMLTVSICNISNADMGPKPSITIKLKNMDSDNYIIDLLTYANKDNFSDLKEYENYINHLDTNSTNDNDYSNEPIYLYNEDNWMATAMRDGLLWGSVVGNSEHIHSFNYFGVPDVFKVIIQMPDGTLRISDVIERKEFDARYIIDVKNMEIKDGVSTLEKVWNQFANILPFLLPLLVTIVVELIIAKFFITKNSNNRKIIILVNLLTNVIFQIAIWNLPNILHLTSFFSILNYAEEYLLVFIIGEILVVLSEIKIYSKYLKDTDKKKIIKYTIIANIVTAMLTFFSYDSITTVFIDIFTHFVNYLFELKFIAMI